MKKAVFPIWEDLMVKRNLNFTSLSEKLPLLSSQAWRRRFVGESKMTNDELLALARFFDVTPNDLLEGARIEGGIYYNE